MSCVRRLFTQTTHTTLRYKTAAATCMSPPPAKEAKASGHQHRHYRVSTRCSPYYHHTTGGWHGSKEIPSGWTATCGGVVVCIAARCESKVNVMGGPTAMTADCHHCCRTTHYRQSQLLHVMLLTNIRTSVKSREISRDRS